MPNLRKLTLLSILLIVLSSCTSGYKNGTRVHTTQECFSAINPVCYDVMTSFCNERNESAIISMIEDGEVYVIPAFTYGEVSDYKPGRYEIDFNKYGKVWVASEFISN